MGDRCLISVKNGDEIGCTVYVHWRGSEALSMLRDAIPGMRQGDLSYSVARLTGQFHIDIPGNLSLGVFPPLAQIPPKDDDSHGDAGILVYDCGTGETNAYHGYLADDNEWPQMLPVPPG